MARNAKRPHDDAGYRKRRELLMKSITEHTRCWRCGKLAHQHPQTHKSGRRATWQCGHTVDGDNRAPLALEWSTCNVAAGASLGHRRAFGRFREAAEPRTAGPHYPGHYNLDDPQSVGAPPCVRIEGALCDVCRDWRART